MSRARQVAEMAKTAETDRTLRTLPDLCSTVGLRPRTVQRLFLQHAGVSPTWVLRRYRLLDAAEQVRDGQPVSWAAVAAHLGYADQADLTRPNPALTLLPVAGCGGRPRWPNKGTSRPWARRSMLTRHVSGRGQPGRPRPR